MKCEIIIHMDNAAFSDEPATELARILRGMANRVEDGAEYLPAMDYNGNRVGLLQVTETLADQMDCDEDDD